MNRESYKTILKKHIVIICVSFAVFMFNILIKTYGQNCTKNVVNFSGGGKLEFIKMANDFPSNGKTTLYYKLWASTPKDVSHFDIFVGTCLKDFYGGGIYTNTTNTSGLKYNSCWKLGQDGSATGKPWVLKYDCGITRGDSVQVFFVLNDTFGLTKNATLIKYGTTFVYDSICGPHIQCSTPVLFGYISVKNVGNTDEVRFSTFTELNNDTFIVERSYGDNNWVPVSGIKGAGNSSQRIDYSVKINLYDSDAKKRYYRVKQIDFNGDFDYSPITSISSEPVVGFYPNPANQGHTITFSLANFDELFESKLLVINSLGKVVFSRDFTGSNVFEVSELAKGVYSVRIESREISRAEKLVIN